MTKRVPYSPSPLNSGLGDQMEEFGGSKHEESAYPALAEVFGSFLKRLQHFPGK